MSWIPRSVKNYKSIKNYSRHITYQVFPLTQQVLWKGSAEGMEALHLEPTTCLGALATCQHIPDSSHAPVNTAELTWKWLDVCLSVHHCTCVENKNQLDSLNALLHLRYAQHVSGTSMPIIRSSILYVRYYRLWCAVLGCWLSGVRCRTAGYASRQRDVARQSRAKSLFLNA